jgi:hypothetical protein
MSVHTFKQRDGLASYRAAQLDAIYAAERARILNEWREPEPLSFWHQIATELADAPLHIQIGMSVFFGTSIGITIAIFEGWS